MRRLMLAVLLGLAPVGAAAEIPFEPVVTLESMPPCFDCAFGGNVVAVGSRVLVTQSRRMPGAVQLFDATTGALLRTFASPEPDRAVDTFGLSIAVVGDRYLLVGASWGMAPGQDGPVHGGVAYLFDVQSGALRHTFTARAPRDWDRFGASVAARGTVALVWGGRESVVYAFDAETGALVRVYPVSVHDARLVDRPIAALGADVVVGDGNAIQVLDGATGAVRLTIATPDEAALGTRVVVTHAGDVYAQGGLGVYRFDGGDGTLVRRYDGFTGPLAVSECTILVRGPTCGEPGFAAGAYLLDADTGRRLAVVCAPEHAYVPHFASAGAIVGDRILLGDPSEDAAVTAYLDALARRLG
jgi:outer membrane protein assembly factor BamB